MDKQEARHRIVRIQNWVDAFPMDDVMALYNDRAWLQLGYDTWADLCETEFRVRSVQFLPESRRPLVVGLIEGGLSQRAVASVFGVSPPTVNEDLQLFRNRTVAVPEATVGLDGKTRKRVEPITYIQPEEPQEAVSGTVVGYRDELARVKKALNAVIASKGDIEHVLMYGGQAEHKNLRSLAQRAIKVAAALDRDIIYAERGAQ